MWIRLRYSRSGSSQTTKTLTLLEMPESTAHFGLPSNLTFTGTNRADDCDDLCLGLVRSLGLAESHSANLRRGGRPRLIARSHDTGSPLAEWCPSVECIEALDNIYLFPTIDKKSWKSKTRKFRALVPFKNPITFSHEFFGGSNYLS